MSRYKLIVAYTRTIVADFGPVLLTGEYDNIVETLSEAASVSESLRREWSEQCPEEVYVECFPYSENIDTPSKDYRVWTRQGDKVGWQTMTVDLGRRVGIV